jgi:hypothetical protein
LVPALELELVPASESELAAALVSVSAPVLEWESVLASAQVSASESESGLAFAAYPLASVLVWASAIASESEPVWESVTASASATA